MTRFPFEMTSMTTMHTFGGSEYIKLLVYETIFKKKGAEHQIIRPNDLYTKLPHFWKKSFALII